MRTPIQCRLKLAVATLLLLAYPKALFSQNQDGAVGTQISVKSGPLLKVFLREQLHLQLEAQGGTYPYTWKLVKGSLPQGISLEPAGILSGTPMESGDFGFAVTVSDSGRPAHQRNQELVLRVLAPLLVQWSHPARINGQRIEGSIKVSNQTEKDFDLTAIVLAVNEIGRATTIGYQHFTLKRGTTDLEIPFGENLPPGGYQINVDVVAEIAETNTIYRARLVTPGKLQVVQGP